MKTCVKLLLLLLLFSAPCLAQSSHPLLEVYSGFSYVRLDGDERDNRNLYGWSGAFSVNANKTFGFTVDASGHYQDNIIARTRFFSIAAGPRFTARNEHATTFAHILFGGTHLHERVNTLTDHFTTHGNTFAVAMGGGFDVNVTPHFGVRVIQAEYVLSKFNRALSGKSVQHNARVGIGIVFRFANRSD
ncbi:MAG TPA: outer membrane beta-barrel protein [Blastocatellia bacterium]|nr:outer membrane beta-barrel protein [Blastocatellia bacterium]